jgi:cytochrome b561
MAAQAERSQRFPTHACYRQKMVTALHGCIALVAVVIGVVGLLGASGQMLEVWVSIHALFGLLLCGLVLARCRWCVKHSPPMSLADVRQLSRQLSRIVYVLLFVVLGVREIIGILNSLWHGGAVDFNLFDARFRNGPDFEGFNPKDGFQLFVASGLFALIFVRGLAFRLWLLRCDDAAEPSTTNHGVDVNRPSK